MRASSWSVVGGVLVAAGCSSAFSAGTGGAGGTGGSNSGSTTSTSGPTSSSTSTATASGSSTTSHSTTSHSTTSHSTTSSSTSSTSISASTSSSTASGPDCPPQGGGYTITAANANCGTVDKSTMECFKPTPPGSCTYGITATSATGGLFGVTGTISVDSSGNFDNMNLTIAEVTQQGCSGSWMGPPGTNPGTLTIQCSGGCDLTLTHSTDTCP